MLSYRQAQIDAMYEKCRNDTWLKDNLYKLPNHSLLGYLTGTYQVGEPQAEELLKMLVREYPGQKPVLGIRQIEANQEDAIESVATQARYFIGQELHDNPQQDPWLLFRAFVQSYRMTPQEHRVGGVSNIALGIVLPKVQERLMKLQILPKPEAVPEASVRDIDNIVEDKSTDLTPDYVLSLYDKAKSMKDKGEREKLMQQVIQLSKRLGMVNKRAQTQNQIVIPPTADSPVARTVTLPPAENVAPPDPSKVVVDPKTPEEKKDALDKAVDDGQKTRQEQLTNSFKAMEVVLKDFVKAMYDIELSRERIGKMMEKLIDNACDAAAEQTADTVKQLASPYLGV